jgi:hypothetical protein
VPEHHDPGRIADDLADCRQRGLDWLDRRTTNQAPVPATALQRLAEDYVTARHIVAADRIAQIKTLLRDGIEELSQQGHRADATLLHDLFFGDPPHGTMRPPGELLKAARAKAGNPPEARFRERRANVMRSFAQFLIVFVAPAVRGSADKQQARASEYRQLATIGYVGDNEHFIQQLSEAVNVTIIGITNGNLGPMLQEALQRKRAAGNADAFWGDLRIVFLAKELLYSVNDEREDFRDSPEALRQRRQEAVWARKSVGSFLKRTQSTRWTLYEYPYMMPLTGALLDFGDKKTVHLLMRNPQRTMEDHLYLDMDDLRDQYFSAMFEGIIRQSKNLNEILPVGTPVGTTFSCKGVSRRSDVLKDRSSASGWLPMVLIVTSRRRNAQVNPILQLRTENNSARELNRISHLGSHIIRDDLVLSEGVALAFGLRHEIPMNVARRVIEEVTGIDPASSLRPMTTGSYLYPDKEHLFFFVFALDLGEDTQLPRRAEMHSYPLSELLAIRANQALRVATDLCQTAGFSERAWNAAREVAALNLYLHDYPDLAEQILSLDGQQGDEMAKVATTVKRLVTEQTSPSWVAASHQADLMGLAGWQYREFFSVLLPLYAEIGVDGADDLLDQVTADRRKAEALTRLAELYQDEQLMVAMPIEL